MRPRLFLGHSIARSRTKSVDLSRRLIVGFHDYVVETVWTNKHIALHFFCRNWRACETRRRSVLRVTCSNAKSLLATWKWTSRPVRLSPSFCSDVVQSVKSVHGIGSCYNDVVIQLTMRMPLRKKWVWNDATGPVDDLSMMSTMLSTSERAVRVWTPLKPQSSAYVCSSWTSSGSWWQRFMQCNVELSNVAAMLATDA